jgi:DNA polymerase gamma 1
MVNWVSLRRRVAELQITETETGLMSIPNDIVHGTWTRRKAGKLWLVASNPKPGKIGTEAKSFIEPPVVNGVQWKLVGADFDSQELRLASLLGDAVHKMVGSTPLSVSVIAGEKKSGTDTHSVIAKVAGCSRDTAKALVYGAVYGLGLKKATQNVMVATGKGHEEGEAIAKKILGTLKGAYGYEGLGADSFAELDRMASVSQPVTPILGDPLSKAGALSTDFKTSKVNWTIQASGRNMLDLLMYFMDILLERYSVEAKHVISIHDQIYYMCPEHLQEKVAYLLAVAHTYAWVVAFERLGLDTIPKAYLVPESIDCDYRVRKTVNSDCVTLSQPEPLAPFGKSYSVGQLAQLFPNGI